MTIKAMQRNATRGWAMGALLAAGLATGAAGCTAPRGLGMKTFEFAVPYEAGCPKEPILREDQQNCGFIFKDKHCAKVFRGDTIVFKAEGAVKQPFEIFFDPFERSERTNLAPVQSFRIAKDAPYKAYPFSITARGCPTLDPVIIIEH